MPEKPTRPAKLTKRAVEALEPREAPKPGTPAPPYEVRDSELRGFLVRVEPSGTKSFFFDYRLAGRRNRYKLGTYPNLSPDGARELARVTAGEVAQGIDVAARKKAQKAETERARLSTLAAFLERYEAWEATHRKVRHAARIRSAFPAAWLGQPITAIDSWKLESWRRDARKSGKQATTVNRDIAALKSVLSKAIDWGIIDASGIAKVRPLKTDPIGRVRFLTIEEEQRLRATLQARDREMRERRARFNEHLAARGQATFPPYPEPYADHLEPLILLLLNTGMRFGEATQLRHADLHLSDRLITVRGGAGTATAGEGAKSGRTRVIPMNLEAHRILSALKGSPDAYVFPSDGGARLTTVKKSWGAVLEVAKIEGFRLHDLRHTFASRVKRGGADLYTVQRLLGHSSPFMTQRYAHLQPDDLRAAVEKVGQ